MLKLHYFAASYVAPTFEQNLITHTLRLFVCYI